MGDILRSERRVVPVTAALAAAMCVALAPLAAPAQTLQEAVRTALTSNPAAQAADADVRATALELLQLEAEYLPTVSVFGEAGASYYDDPDEIVADQSDEALFAREVGVRARLTLFDGYARANRVFRDSARLDGAIFRLYDASETLALSAVQAYIDVVRHIRLLQVSDQNVARHVAIERQVDELVDGGRLPASAGFEIDERLMAARLARLEVQNALADARARYEAVIGAQPGTAMSVPDPAGLPNSRETLVARAVDRSFRVRLADTQIRQRSYEKAVREADQLPEVSLEAGARYGVDQFGTEGEESDAFVGLRVDWELYAGGRKARSGALTARAREAQAERDEVVREVQEFATRTWNAYQTGIERVLLLEMRRRAADNVVAQYREEFRAGTRTLLDVLDAERTFFNVRFEEVSARASLDFNEYRLLAAESRLAAHFGVAPAEVALDPSFERRARANPRAVIFNTDIQALE